MALHPTLLLPPPPLCSKRPKEILQLPESRVSKSQASKYSETHQGKYTSSRGPEPRGITEGQGEAELWFFFLITVRKYQKAGQSREDERLEALLMNEAE